MGLAYEDEEYNLQPLPDALHSRRVGYMPLVDSGNCFLGQPREASTPGALSMTGREWKRKDAIDSDAPAVCFGKSSHHHQNQQTTERGTPNWEQTMCRTSANVGEELATSLCELRTGDIDHTLPISDHEATQRMCTATYLIDYPTFQQHMLNISEKGFLRLWGSVEEYL